MKIIVDINTQTIIRAEDAVVVDIHEGFAEGKSFHEYRQSIWDEGYNLGKAIAPAPKYEFAEDTYDDDADEVNPFLDLCEFHTVNGLCGAYAEWMRDGLHVCDQHRIIMEQQDAIAQEMREKEMDNYDC